VAQQRLCCATCWQASSGVTSDLSARAEINSGFQGCSKNDVWLKQTKQSSVSEGRFS
jgi:hypothetical protein